MNMDTRLTKLIDWMRTSAAPANGLLVPLSGGSDSALIFWLLNQAFPATPSANNKIIGVHVGDNLRCREWFESVGTVRMVAKPTLSAGQDAEVMRWATVQSLCVNERRWLVGSRTRTEEALGTFSYASCVATYLPLASILKSDVMELCALAGVPEEILASSRRADPDCGRPQAMAEIPLEQIDIFLRVKLQELPSSALEALGEATVKYLDGVCKRNQFKRVLPKRGPVV
jgi:NH3-dependent NAD+ synthetase